MVADVQVLRCGVVNIDRQLPRSGARQFVLEPAGVARIEVRELRAIRVVVHRRGERRHVRRHLLQPGDRSDPRDEDLAEFNHGTDGLVTCGGRDRCFEKQADFSGHAIERIPAASHWIVYGAAASAPLSIAAEPVFVSK